MKDFCLRGDIYDRRIAEGLICVAGAAELSVTSGHKVTSITRLFFWYILPAYDCTFIMHETQAAPEFHIGDGTRSGKWKESKDQADKIDPVQIIPAQSRQNMKTENSRGSAEYIQKQVVNVGRTKIKNILAGLKKET